MYVRLAGQLGLAYCHLQKTSERHLGILGDAEPPRVPAEGLLPVQLDGPAVAGEAQVLRLAEQAPKQLEHRPHCPGWQELGSAGCRQVLKKVAGGQARRRCCPTAVSVPAGLHPGADEGEAQLTADPGSRVIGGVEEVRARIHVKAVDAVAGEASVPAVLGLQQGRLNRSLLRV